MVRILVRQFVFGVFGFKLIANTVAQFLQDLLSCIFGDFIECRSDLAFNRSAQDLVSYVRGWVTKAVLGYHEINGASIKAVGVFSGCRMWVGFKVTVVPWSLGTRVRFFLLIVRFKGVVVNLLGKKSFLKLFFNLK